MASALIECYKFVANHATWFITSYYEPIVLGYDEYIPTPITRTALEISSVIDTPRTMDFRIPYNHQIAKDFCFIISPTDLEVTVLRGPSDGDIDDFTVEWRGNLSGTALDGEWAVIKTASIIQTQLNGFLSSIYYQKSCNHVLFDTRCKVLREDFTEVATVTLIQNQVITVDDMVYANGELINGTMTVTRTGEKQLIVGNNTDVIQIGYPFFDIVLGDEVELTLGCNHQRLGHCKTRFDNVDNYGGTDFVPEVNPFEKLVYTTSTRTDLDVNGEVEFKLPLRIPSSSNNVGPSKVITNSPFARAGRPRPVSSSDTTFSLSSTEGQGNIPQSQLGIPIPAIIGRKRVPNHNLLWTGNLRAITETVSSTKSWSEEVNHGGGFTETITYTETTYTTTVVGYLCDILLGVCLGPDAHLLAIYIDGNLVWEGDAGPERTAIAIPEGEFFISGGTVYWSGGAFDQAPEPLIDVADFPGHVGIAYAFLKDVRADLAMGQLSFEVVRIPNPLGLADSINQTGDDVNIISAAVEIVTNEWGWCGLDIGFVDQPTFTAMAIDADTEGNIVSIKVDYDVSAASLLSTLSAQALMVIYELPSIGQITGKLIRFAELDYETTRRYSPANIIELRDFQKTSWSDAIDQMRGLYTERDAEYNEVPVFAQNTANVQQTGRTKKTATFTYPFVPNKELCIDLVFRDLATLAAPTYSFSLLTNSDGMNSLPGDFVTVTWPLGSLLNLPMQVVSVRKQDLVNNTAVLLLKQAVFPDNTALFAAGGGEFDPEFDTAPKTPLDATIITAPYYMVRSINGVTTSDTNPLNYPLFLPHQANDLQVSFTIFLNNQPGSPVPPIIRNGSSYPCRASLAADIDQLDGFDTGEAASITIDNVFNADVLTDISESGVRSGRLFMFIGDEILSFEDVTDNLDGSYTLGSVHRALLDTVFEAHTSGDPVYIVTNNFNFVSGLGFPLPIGYTPSWSLVSNSVAQQGQYSDGLVTSGWTPDAMRTLSPLRPHNTQVNGGTRSETQYLAQGEPADVTWFTRSRTSPNVKLMLDPSEDGEISGTGFQTHRVFIIDSAATLHDCGATVTDVDTLVITVPAIAAIGLGVLYVQAEIDIAGIDYTSIYQDRIPVYIAATLPRLTEDGEYRMTEDAEIRTIE